MAYVKVKRPEQTVFVYAETSDTVETVVSRLLEMTKAPFTPDNIKLVHKGEVMDPKSKLERYTTADGEILHEIRCHEGKWEPLPEEKQPKEPAPEKAEQSAAPQS